LFKNELFSIFIVIIIIIIIINVCY